MWLREMRLLEIFEVFSLDANESAELIGGQLAAINPTAKRHPRYAEAGTYLLDTKILLFHIYLLDKYCVVMVS